MIGEDEVRLGLRQIAVFLHGVPESDAGDPAGHDRTERLNELVPGVLSVCVGIEEWHDPPDSIGLGEDQTDERDQAKTGASARMCHQASTCDEQHA